jgi:hypothetical protein
MAFNAQEVEERIRELQQQMKSRSAGRTFTFATGEFGMRQFGRAIKYETFFKAIISIVPKFKGQDLQAESIVMDKLITQLSGIKDFLNKLEHGKIKQQPVSDGKYSWPDAKNSARFKQKHSRKLNL